MFKFRHACVLTSDLKKSVEFYKQFGFEVQKEKHMDGIYIQKLLGIPGLELTYVKFTLPGEKIPVFELHHWTQTDLVYGWKNKYASHISLTTTDLKTFYAKNKTIIKFISEPLKAPDSKCMVCFIEDPDGNMIELVEELNAKPKRTVRNTSGTDKPVQ